MTSVFVVYLNPSLWNGQTSANTTPAQSHIQTKPQRISIVQSMENSLYPIQNHPKSFLSFVGKSDKLQFNVPEFKILGWNTEDSDRYQKKRTHQLELNYINKLFYQNLELLIVHWLCLIVPDHLQWGACQLPFLNI